MHAGLGRDGGARFYPYEIETRNRNEIHFSLGKVLRSILVAKVSNSVSGSKPSGASEKDPIDFGLGGGFRQVLRFPPQL